MTFKLLLKFKYFKLQSILLHALILRSGDVLLGFLLEVGKGLHSGTLGSYLASRGPEGGLDRSPNDSQ